MLTARYKRYAKGGMYAAGGDMDLAMGLGQGAAIMGSLVDAWNRPNRYGRQGMAGNMLSSAGNLAAAGSVFGPFGTAIGGGVGLAAGLVKSLGQNKIQKRAEAQEAFSNQQQEQQRAQVALAGDPTLLTGNRGASYYARGGYLRSYGDGGDTTLYNGNKHPLFKNVDGHYIDVSAHDRQWVDSVLNANKSKNFVQRFLNPGQYPILNNSDGSYSTESMANDKTRAFPTVVQKGKGKPLERLKGDSAWDYADSTNEYINFKNAADADWFASNGYKLSSAYKLAKKEKGGYLNHKVRHAQGYTEMQSQSPYTGNYATGGSLKPLSSTAIDVQGPSHAEGGVQVPGTQAEVEGGETINGNYVFSKQLGFAQIHRPIAKAIGKIEQKAMSPERINSLKFLKETEHRLQLSQEFVRNLHNTQQHA